MSPQEIREKADAIRKKYWSGKNLPVNVEHIIEFDLKLDIQPVLGLFSKFNINAWLKLDCTGIIVDADQYERFPNHLRFYLAHELGHFFLPKHRSFFDRFKFNSLQEWIEFVSNIPEKEYTSFEFQANEFGGRLVVPLPELKIRMAEACKKLKAESSLLQYLSEYPDFVLSHLSPFLCKPFAVSENVIEARVKREKLWPPKDYFPDLF